MAPAELERGDARGPVKAAACLVIFLAFIAPSVVKIKPISDGKREDDSIAVSNPLRARNFE